MPTLPDIEVGTLAVNYADYTQRIANSLPSYHIARRYKESTVAKVLNAVAGKPLEHFNEQELPNVVSQLSLSSATVFTNDKAFVVDTSRQNSVKRQVVRNYLRNSTFKSWTNPVLPPDYWSLRLTDPLLEEFVDFIQAYLLENFQDGISLRVSNLTSSNLPFGTERFRQVVTVVDDDTSQEWQFSVFTKRAGEEALGATTFKAEIKFIYKDGTSQSYNQAIPDSETWNRVVINVTSLKKPIKEIEVGISVVVASNIDAQIVEVTSFALFNSHGNNSWSKHPGDKPKFISTLQSGKTVMQTYREASTRIQYYEISDAELESSLLPTEAEIEFFQTEELGAVESGEAFIRVPNGHMMNGQQVPQGIAIATIENVQKYGWPLSVQGALVKVDMRDPSEIHGVYRPSFPMSDTEAHAVTTLQLMCMTRRANTIWLMAKLIPGSSMKYMKDMDLFLFCLDFAFPKVANNDDDVDVTTPMFLPIKTSYMFSGASLGGSYGSGPYGVTPYGGATPVTQIPHVSMEFISNRQIKTRLRYYFESVITLRYRYFLDNGNSIVLLEDPKSVDSNAEVVVW